MHRAATNLPLLITVKKGGSTRDGGTLIVVLLRCCFSELDRYLKPDKKRAEELRKEFQAGFDGIASRIWPNLRIIRGRTTGMLAKCHVFVFIRLKKKKKLDTRMLRITTRSLSHSFQRRSLYILFQSHHEKDSIAVEAFFSPIFNSS